MRLLWTASSPECPISQCIVYLLKSTLKNSKCQKYSYFFRTYVELKGKNQNVVIKDSGREGPACRVISCRMERGMNYCVYAHLRQLIAISRHFWSVLKSSRHAASENHSDMADAAEFNMIVSEFLTRQKAQTKQSKAMQSKRKKKQHKQNETFVDKTKQNKKSNTNKTNYLHFNS